MHKLWERPRLEQPNVQVMNTDICGATEFDNDYQTVYFSYTVSAPSANLSISVNGTGAPALSAGSIAFYDDCGTNDLGDEYDRINLTV
jgi:hypothetical protein